MPQNMLLLFFNLDSTQRNSENEVLYRFYAKQNLKGKGSVYVYRRKCAEFQTQKAACYTIPLILIQKKTKLTL